MKITNIHSKEIGLTLIEVLAVAATIVVIAFILFPNHHIKKSAHRVQCMSNLKQIDLAFLMYAEDNRAFPMQVSAQNGGTKEFIYTRHVFPHFEKLNEYLRDSRFFNLLVCPSDTTKQAAASTKALSDLNISYFLNADYSLSNQPSQFLALGDRDLTQNKQAIKSGTFAATTNLDLDWSGSEIHFHGGNLAFADGHVEWNKIGEFTTVLQRQPLATNRLCIP